MKIEVVYYSATGNTKNVAEKIVQITGGDIFEIEPTPIRMMISTGQMLTAACQENMLTSLIKLNRLHKGFHFALLHVEFL